MALDRLGQQPLFAKARPQYLHRHLARAEAGNLDAAGKIRGRVLDRVLHVLAGHVDFEPDLVVSELFDLDGHPSIQAKRFRLPSAR